LLNRLADEASGLPGHAAGKSRYDVSFGLLWDANQVADVLSGKVRFPSDPQAIHDAWLLLSADQRTELLLADPLRFGNLNGIPVADRDVANRATLKQQLDLLFRAFVSAHLPVPLSREDLDRMSPGTLAGLERFSGLSVREFRQALLLKAQLDRNTSGVTLLMAYEPGVYGGKGRAAIAFGDPDHADNVAFCVPGLLSSVDKIGDLAGDALNLNGQAFQADPRHKTAIIAWQGYDAPDVFSVASEDSAERGARLLAADVNAMRTTHAGAIGKLTVVGHSYGSTTTGLALQREGMKVDQVALIGSPGVGGEATTVADLHLNRSQVFVGSASRDLVTSITTILPINDFLGLDPSLDTFGATRFKAESVKRGDNNNTADHSLYYDAFNESESLYALADIVSGHGDRLGQDGMLAQPRHIEVVPTGEGRSTAVTRDPEDLRAPSAGFDHAFDAGIPSP
jgi:pimeloyl-ACP methyl ester carboxylesterase